MSAAAGELLRALDLYSPQDRSEEASLDRTRQLLLRAADPFTRAVPDHVTASAVVARPDGSAFLLVHHRRLGSWLQPGGHVEPDDVTVFDAARREAAEETGVMELEMPLGPRVLDVDVHPIPPRGGKPAHVHHDVRYLLTTTARAVSPAPAEVADVRWFTLEEALASGADPSLARALRKAAALLRQPSGLA